MQNFERVCPHCGASNSYQNARCQNCGSNLNTLQPAANNPNRSLVKSGGGALVIGATMFLARVGFQLALRGVRAGLERAAARATTPRESTPSRAAGTDNPTNAPDREYVLRGWRAWSVDRQGERASGSEKFEWTIKKK